MSSQPAVFFINAREEKVHDNEKEEDFKIPVKDITRTIRKGKGKILLGSLCFAALLGGFSLIKPVQYEGEGSFKEKANNASSMQNSSVASLILGELNSSTQNEATAIMRSKRLLGQVGKTLGMQAVLQQSDHPSKILENIKENLLVEYHYLRDLKKLALPDKNPMIKIHDIEFPGELPKLLQLTFHTDQAFQVFNSDKKSVGAGKIGTPFIAKEYSFLLSSKANAPLKGSRFSLTLLPLDTIAKSLTKKVKFKREKENSSLVKLTYQDKDRKLAADVLNQLMLAYQNYLRDEQQRISSEQIHYLNNREEEMQGHLKDVVDTFAAKLSADASSYGYAYSDKALDFLTHQFQKFREKALLIDLDLKRFVEIQKEDPNTQAFAILQSERSGFINQMTNEIFKLKQQGDSIEIAMNNSSNPDPVETLSSFYDQVGNIEQIRRCSKEACQLLVQLEKGKIPSSKKMLQIDSKYTTGAWIDSLKEIKAKEKSAASPQEKRKAQEEFSHFKEQFTSYLTNLIHHLEVSEKTVQERLIHQQLSPADFQGINLETASQLYISYSKELSSIEAEILQYSHLIEEIKNPDFEISSLSSIIKDPVTRSLVENASPLVLALQDDANRSAKEKERVKTELQIKRKFLELHLKQTIDLLKLQKELIKDKIRSLQNATLELIRQQTSILEKQLSDSINRLIANLKEEKNLINDNEAHLKKEMSRIPTQWAAEKMIEQKMKMNAIMVEEITKLIESKNISSNLDVIKSAPLDTAIPPIKPVHPHLILLSLLGAALGALFTAGGLVAKRTLSGFPVSKENLELQGLRVAGVVTKSSLSKEKGVKKLCSLLFDQKPSEGVATLFFLEKSSSHLHIATASLLQKWGNRIMIIDCTSPNKGPFPSFNKLSDLLITKDGAFDKMTLDVNDLFEMITTNKLQQLKKLLIGSYDWIIAVSNLPAASVEIEAIVPEFDFSAIALKDEKTSQITPLIQALKEKERLERAAFLLLEGT